MKPRPQPKGRERGESRASPPLESPIVLSRSKLRGIDHQIGLIDQLSAIIHDAQYAKLNFLDFKCGLQFAV